MLLPLLIVAVVCGGGDAQQLLDPLPRPCRDMNAAGGNNSDPGNRVNEYPAGGVLMVLADVPGGLSGQFEFYLCPEDAHDDVEECLVRVPLQLGDGSGTRYRLDDIDEDDKFQIPLLLPDDIICDRCTLQWRVVVTACDDSDECGILDQTYCSDITIRQLNKKQDKRLFTFLARLFGR